MKCRPVLAVDLAAPQARPAREAEVLKSSALPEQLGRLHASRVHYLQALLATRRTLNVRPQSTGTVLARFDKTNNLVTFILDIRMSPVRCLWLHYSSCPPTT